MSQIVVVNSLDKAITKAKNYGNLDNTDIYLYDILQEYDEYTKNNYELLGYNSEIKSILDEFSRLNSDIICNSTYVLQNNIVKNPGTIPDDTFILNSFTVTTEKELVPLLSSTQEYDVYKFKIQDLLDNYSSTSIYQLTIDRTDLDGGVLILDPIFILDEGPSTTTILLETIPDLWYVATSTSQFLHNIPIKLFTIGSNGKVIGSNSATLTIDRTALETANQPPTVGDIALKVNNRAITTITFAMVTSSLTPPYNDPEGDLLDAIRIKEISTANTGIFYYSGVPITVGQIITREDIIAELFTHEGANVNTIETDAINFEVRDEGSGIWVS